MNNITDLLDLEDSDIKISDIIIEGQTKTLIIETPPVASYCPICGFRMHSRGVKKRTINHPILQDGYSLILLLKQRRWRCSNPDCLYEVNESFRFVNKGRRTSLKWLDYVITRQELEEADSLCHGNWIEIQRKNQYIQTLQEILDSNHISFPDEI